MLIRWQHWEPSPRCSENICHCFSGQIERQAAPGEDGNHQNWTSSLRYRQHLGPIIVFIQTAPRRRAPFHAPLLQKSPHSESSASCYIYLKTKQSLFPVPLPPQDSLFCFASVTGEVPAEPRLLTAPTSSSLTLERQLLFLHQHLKAQLAALSLPKLSTSLLLVRRFQRPICTLDFISSCLWIFTCPLMFGKAVGSLVSRWSIRINLLSQALIRGVAF